jgi:transposase
VRSHAYSPRVLAVGIDLGLKETAVTSGGERLEALRFYRDAQGKLGSLVG